MTKETTSFTDHTNPSNNGVLWLFGLALVQPLIHIGALFVSEGLLVPYGPWQLLLVFTFLVPVMGMAVAANWIRAKYRIHVGYAIAFTVGYILIALALLQLMMWALTAG